MADSVTVPGTNASVAVPTQAAAAAAGGVWTVEYEVDFSDQAVYDFLVTGATAGIGGVTWTAVNRTATDADVFDFDGSTGLRINAKGAPNNNGHWYAANMSQPYFYAKLDDMMSNLDDNDTLCLQLEMDTTADVASQWQRYGLGIWKESSTSTGFVVASRFWNGSAACNATIRDNVEDNDPNVTQPDFFEIMVYPANAMITTAGVIGGADFPDPLATSTYNAYTAMLTAGPGSTGGLGYPTFRIPIDDACFVITCQVQGSSTPLNATAKKMRVLRRDKS